MRVKIFPLLFLLLLAPTLAQNVTISPTYASIEVNTSLTFHVKISGISGVRTIRVYAPFVDVNEKKVWISPYGKDFEFTFTPEVSGRYEVTVEIVEDGLRTAAIVNVFERTPEYEMLEEELEKLAEEKGNTTEIRELWELLKQGKLELLKIRLEELKNTPYTVEVESKIQLKILILVLLAVISAFLVKVFLK